MPDPFPGEPSDATLLRRHANGDPDAFGLLFKRHSRRLWAVALRVTCDPEDAADALQEAMISAFRRADGFRGESSVTTWLHRIVVNASLDLLRRRQARPAGWPGDLDDLAAADPGPSADSAAGADSRMDVDAALRTLTPPQRAALVLVDMFGYSVADASVILGVPEGTVKSRCARGRAQLLPRIAHLRGDYPAERNQAAVDSVSSEQGGGA